SMSVQNGANGGTLIGISGGTFFGNGFIDTPTASVPAGIFAGAGGIVSLSTINGALNVNSPIQVSYNDAGAGRHSASGGAIGFNGGAITSETLLASSRGDLSVGSTTPVNISAVTLSLLASRNLSWSGGTLMAAPVNSSGNVTLRAGNDLSISGAVDIRRFVGAA